jgi:putative transposase
VVDEDDLVLRRLIDEQYTQTPFYGSRKMAAHLRRQGAPVNRKHVQRLMRTIEVLPIVKTQIRVD